MGEGVFRKEKKNIYKGANQTENFTGVKTRNDIYYRGEKHRLIIAPSNMAIMITQKLCIPL